MRTPTPTTGPDQGRTRGSNGRFRKGNPGGPGNPHVGSVAAFRAALFEVVTEKDIVAVWRKLVALAKAGEPWAIKEFLDRTLGKAVQAAEVRDEPDEEKRSVRTWAEIMRPYTNIRLPLPPGVPRPHPGPERRA